MLERHKLKTEDYISDVIKLTSLLNKGIKISEAFRIIADEKGLSESQVRTRIRDSVKKGITYIEGNPSMKRKYYYIKLKQDFL